MLFQSLQLPAKSEWSSDVQCCTVAWTVLGLNPHQCLWTHGLQVCGSKRLSCHADLCTVSRCHTRGKSEDHTGEKACKGSTLVLNPRADVTRRPKQGYQWSYKKDFKNLKNRKDSNFQMSLVPLSYTPVWTHH